MMRASVAGGTSSAKSSKHAVCSEWRNGTTIRRQNAHSVLKRGSKRTLVETPAFAGTR
jgi:hypothetical protein